MSYELPFGIPSSGESQSIVYRDIPEEVLNRYGLTYRKTIHQPISDNKQEISAISNEEFKILLDNILKKIGDLEGKPIDFPRYIEVESFFKKNFALLNNPYIGILINVAPTPDEQQAIEIENGTKSLYDYGSELKSIVTGITFVDLNGYYNTEGAELAFFTLPRGLMRPEEEESILHFMGGFYNNRYQPTTGDYIATGGIVVTPDTSGNPIYTYIGNTPVDQLRFTLSKENLELIANSVKNFNCEGPFGSTIGYMNFLYFQHDGCKIPFNNPQGFYQYPVEPAYDIENAVYGREENGFTIIGIVLGLGVILAVGATLYIKLQGNNKPNSSKRPDTKSIDDEKRVKKDLKKPAKSNATAKPEFNVEILFKDETLIDNFDIYNYAPNTLNNIKTAFAERFAKDLTEAEFNSLVNLAQKLLEKFTIKINIPDNRYIAEVFDQNRNPMYVNSTDVERILAGVSMEEIDIKVKKKITKFLSIYFRKIVEYSSGELKRLNKGGVNCFENIDTELYELPEGSYIALEYNNNGILIIKGRNGDIHLRRKIIELSSIKNQTKSNVPIEKKKETKINANHEHFVLSLHNLNDRKTRNSLATQIQSTNKDKIVYQILSKMGNNEITKISSLDKGIEENLKISIADNIRFYLAGLENRGDAFNQIDTEESNQIRKLGEIEDGSVRKYHLGDTHRIIIFRYVGNDNVARLGYILKTHTHNTN